MAAHRVEDKGGKRLLLLFLPLPLLALLLPLSFLLLLFLDLSSLSFFLASYPLLGRLLLSSFANQEFLLLFFFLRFLVVYPGAHQDKLSREKSRSTNPIAMILFVRSRSIQWNVSPPYSASCLKRINFLSSRKNPPPSCPALYRLGCRYPPRLCHRIPSYMELPLERQTRQICLLQTLLPCRRGIGTKFGRKR